MNGQMEPNCWLISSDDAPACPPTGCSDSRWISGTSSCGVKQSGNAGCLDSSCYRVFKSKLSWQDAENYCVREGGHLASIHSKEENDFVAKLASPVVGRAEPWIGGNDITAEGSWAWSDGSNFSFTSWGEKQPDNTGNNENCLTTNWWNAGQWNDLSCFLQDRVKHFVCKIVHDKQH